MRMLLFLVVGQLALHAFAVPVADTSPIFDIPRLNGIIIDGDTRDWGSRGFAVGPLLTLDGKIRPADNYDACFRLGWNDKGVLFLGIVRDNSIEEAVKLSELGARDAIELFMATKRGDTGFYQAQMTAGADPTYGKARMNLCDYRPDKDILPALTVTVAGKRTADGYVLEALLPFANLGLKPAVGLEVAMQVWMTDSDGPNDWFRTLWYPAGYGGQCVTTNMHRIRLARHTSPAIKTIATWTIENIRRANVTIYAAGELAGKRLTITEGQKTIADGVLTNENINRGTAHITLPLPEPGKPCIDYTIVVSGKPVGALRLAQDVETRRAREFLFLSPRFSPFVFTGETFPGCGYENPQLVEDLIGQYTITTTFYDKDYHLVTRAEKPGRYGAVVETKPVNGGRPHRRFITLFRAPDDVDMRKMAEWVTITFPKEFGFAADLLKEREEGLRGQAGNWLSSGFGRSEDSATVLAALYEDKAGGNSRDWEVTEGYMANLQYWVGLKRKLYGTDKLFPNPFVAPHLKEGTPARVLHDGTPAEAGMKPDTREKLDTLCTEWAKNSDQAFIACVVRHGVVVFHQAYGTHDKQPMTVHTPSYMASLTKFICGTSMMMLVDQEIIGLDDNITRVMPPLQGVPVMTPLTLRRLYSHYNGGWDHWGEYNSSFEEMLADYYPYLNIVNRGDYNGQGYTMGTRIIEQVSGETIDDFYQAHLLKPLGCADTTSYNGSYGTYGTALDMAKIAQMVLNKGAYGNQRFFSEASWQQMMPTQLTTILGPKTDVKYGIGCHLTDVPGLSKNTITHGAASGATLLIDLDNDLIISMTRNTTGANFGKYHPQFIQTIADSLEK